NQPTTSIGSSKNTATPNKLGATSAYASTLVRTRGLAIRLLKPRDGPSRYGRTREGAWGDRCGLLGVAASTVGRRRPDRGNRGRREPRRPAHPPDGHRGHPAARRDI